jgi:hypothetical protein
MGVLGDTAEFEDQIMQACKGDDVSEVAVHSVAPGLSGAAVFLIRRIGFTPWIVKVCSNPALIIAERENNRNRVQGKLPAAPELIATGSSKLLLFSFGGPLASYNPQTLRSGYASSSPEALATLMHRIVTSLKTIHHLSEDVTSCVDRMPLVHKFVKEFQASRSPIPREVVVRLCDLWRKALIEKDQFPRIRSTAHGDLNSGNVLFEAGNAASQPVFIDFASMGRSKDNADYPEFSHLPFWDYAKLERDIQTRLFLKEAIDARIEKSAIIAGIRAINVAEDPTEMAFEPVTKLIKTTSALRGAIQKEYAPADLLAYRIVLAYAMLSVLFRKQPDAEVPQDLQYLVAAESGIALLADPLSPLAGISVAGPRKDTSGIANDGTGTRKNLVGTKPAQFTVEERESPTLVVVEKHDPSSQGDVKQPERRQAQKSFMRSAPHISIRWIAATLIATALSAIAWHQFVRHLGHPATTISSKPDATGTSGPPDTHRDPPAAGEPVAPLISGSNPSAKGLAQPPWGEVLSRVHKEYFSVVKVEESGAVLCTKANDPPIPIRDWPWEEWERWEHYNGPTENITCRQDVEVTEQGPDEARKISRLAVLYRRNKGNWKFLKLAPLR